MDKTPYAGKISKFREERGWTREELANKSMVSARAIEEYEKGFRVPRDEVKLRITAAFNVSAKSLFY